MPMHDFKCYDCNVEVNDVWREQRDELIFPICHSCGKVMVQNFSRTPSDGIIFRPVTLHNVDKVPVTFNSRKEMVNYAKEKKMELGALL
jgi:hypothetical protein